MERINFLQRIFLLLFLIVNLNSFCQDLTNGLVSVWEFDETSGETLFDLFGDNDGVIGSAVNVDQDGIVGKSFNFPSGSGSSVEMGDDSYLSFPNNIFSASFWVKPDLSQTCYLFCKRSESGLYEYYAHIYQDGRIALRIHHDGGSTYRGNLTETSVANLTDVHIAFVCKGNYWGSIDIYINGVKASVINQGENGSGMIDTDATFKIGAVNLAGWGKFNMSQFALWNREITEQEIAQLYNSGNGLAYSEWSGGSTPLTGGSISPIDLTMDSGGDPVTISSNEEASGGVDTITYSWIKSIDDGATWSEITGETGNEYNAPSLTQTTWYMRIATSGVEADSSNISKITVNESPAGGGDLTSGLVSVWEFDETTGTTASDSYGSNDGVISGVTIGQAGKIGKAYSYDGVDDYVEVNYDPSLVSDNFTVSMWINPTSFDGETHGVYRSADGNGYSAGYRFTVYASINLSWGDGASPSGNLEVGPKNPGVWTHVAATYDGTTMKVYYNGAFVDSSTDSYGTNPYHLRFGYGNGLSYYNSLIDQTALWDRPLTEQEIAQLYNSGSGLAYSEWSGGSTPLSAGIISPADSTITSGDDPGVISSTEEASGGSDTITYSWIESIDNGATWSEITGETGTGYNAPSLTQTTWYIRIASSGAEADSSNISKITVEETLTGGTISPTALTITSGQNPGLIASSEDASGGSGTISYKWEQSVDNGSSWLDADSLGTGVSYDPPELTQTTWYRRMAYTAADTAWSNETRITVGAVSSETITSPRINTVDVSTDQLEVNWDNSFLNEDYFLYVRAWTEETLPDGKNVQIQNGIYDFTKTASGFSMSFKNANGYLSFLALDTTSLDPEEIVMWEDTLTLVGTKADLNNYWSKIEITEADTARWGATTPDLVSSVNGQTGDVVLSADDIDDSSSINKFTTQADVDRLAFTSGTNTGDQDTTSIPGLQEFVQNHSAVTLVSGNEPAFDGWDKNASDDFDGDYNSLTNIPAIPVDTDDQTASEVPISDAGAHFTGTDVETALQEVGDSISSLRVDIAAIGGNNWNHSVQSLSGTSPIWDASNGVNATLTLSGNTTINFFNLTAGQTGNLTVTNAATAYTLAFSGYTVVVSPFIHSSGDEVTTSGDSLIDCFSWYYDGTRIIINGTLGYQ
ncbi:LamG-like jellyroll fold domain-containing protein [Sunxiuqinia sp. A32]|uniref:LamG-like jellyroll fold domain-containing protein n=1 Tax=Sunxiuqinia sp. A32 TaxID=3461496 RepID=UPI0040456157